MRALFIIIILGSTLHAPARSTDTVRVYFDIESAVLTPFAQHTLDSLVYHNVLYKGRKVGLIGYADNTGTDTINNPLSLLRAKTVADYLQRLGITDIEMVTGKGAIKRGAQQGYSTDRRVDIIPGGFVQSKQPAMFLSAAAEKEAIQKLSSVEKYGVIRLNTIVFRAGLAEFMPEAYPTLEALVHALKENPQVTIRIEGHVCCHSERDFNRVGQSRATTALAEEEQAWYLLLSTNRAKAVSKYLSEHGISADRLSIKGYSNYVPYYEPDGKTMNPDKNRRVEIRVLSK